MVFRVAGVICEFYGDNRTRISEWSKLRYNTRPDSYYLSVARQDVGTPVSHKVLMDKVSGSECNHTVHSPRTELRADPFAPSPRIKQLPSSPCTL